MPDAAEGSTRSRNLVLVGDATVPLPDECLACYVWRVLGDLGCNASLRWVPRWRDAMAPRATALERKLARRGGFCDCQLFLNVWAAPGSPTAPCHGVRRGSAQPCDLWRDRRSAQPR